MFSTIGYYISIPFALLLRLLYNLTQSYGLSLILFTVVVKLVTLPFQMKSKKNMVRMNRFQPQIKEIQKKYANNQQKMNEEMQLLYAREGVNPMSGCLWSLLPFPIMIALYTIIQRPLSRFMMISADTVTEIRTLATSLGYAAAEGRAAYLEEIGLAQFVSEHFDSFSAFRDSGLFRLSYNFLGVDLSLVPQSALGQLTTGGWAVIGLMLIPILSGFTSFLQSYLAQKGNQMAESAGMSNRMMLIMMPLMMLWLGFTLPAALGVYWVSNNICYMVQEYALNKFYSRRLDMEESEREKKKREERVARMLAAQEQQRQYQATAGKGGKKSEKNEKKQQPKPEKKTVSTTTAGRVGDRPYARGRSYDPEHYGD